ncbi:hypothetical protein [Streptomyces misionensis]|uniref:hypothetical protein n=1 Tax=Streptomyces misionensis TaxID=67331 RepID=UPI0033BB1F80
MSSWFPPGTQDSFLLSRLVRRTAAILSLGMATFDAAARRCGPAAVRRRPSRLTGPRGGGGPSGPTSTVHRLLICCPGSRNRTTYSSPFATTPACSEAAEVGGDWYDSFVLPTGVRGVLHGQRHGVGDPA